MPNLRTYYIYKLIHLRPAPLTFSSITQTTFVLFTNTKGNTILSFLSSFSYFYPTCSIKILSLFTCYAPPEFRNNNRRPSSRLLFYSEMKKKNKKKKTLLLAPV